MKYKFLILTPILFSSFYTSAKDLCGVGVEFKNSPRVARNTHSLSESISLFTKQYKARAVIKGETVVYSVNCQTLNGADYTGNAEEVAGYVQSSLSQLKQKGFKDFSVEKLEATNLSYQGKLPFHFYKIKALNQDLQPFEYLNLYLFDKQLNTIYITSVAGLQSTSDLNLKEFEFTINSLKIQNN
ncbi:hypothetical protein [Pseudoalteromonas sp. G4]|uniref:hypothetical protein n=1 Tax=Pseudoalteromonas sp. G4 TaxID=2992761 RepID=UPI00237E945B|nr:hypothetical protein [Pseudoalteromonas sp. G4]MDE3271239.1 hypothetical protein [Pseudoalteromonas sp. G4]